MMHFQIINYDLQRIISKYHYHHMNDYHCGETGNLGPKIELS